MSVKLSEGVGEVRVPWLEGVCVPVEVEDFESMEENQTALDAFLRHGAKERAELAHHLHAYYEDVALEVGYDALEMERLQGPQEVFEHIELTEMSVSRGSIDPVVYVMITGECAWEPEHGLAISYRLGETLAMVGGYGHLCNADACGEMRGNEHVYAGHHRETLAGEPY